MSLQAYTIEAREWESGDGVDVDVVDEDDLVRSTLQVDYADYDLRPDRGGDGSAPGPERHQFMADSDRIDLQEVRDGRSFTFRVVGDDDVLATLTLADEEWDLEHTG